MINSGILNTEEKILNTLLGADIANTMRNFILSEKYGGGYEDLSECFKELEISEFDLYIENEAIYYIPAFLNIMGKNPINIYSNLDYDTYIYTTASGSEKVLVKPLQSANRNKNARTIITFFRWNYLTVKKLNALNYTNVSFAEISRYILYKETMLNVCKNELENNGVKCLFTKFPQANRIKNQSELEKYVSSKSIYGYKSEILNYGLNKEEIVYGTRHELVKKNGVFQWADVSSQDYNVIEGFRLTTDVPENTEKNIWLFGSSVVNGFFADDAHTISSALQRECNDYFGDKNEYSVVNASNFTGNNIAHIVPLIRKLPIKKGDICIFNLDFPLILLGKKKDIIDLSPYFNRPHLYGEIFIDINHMTGKGYCAQGKVLFYLLKNNGFFENSDTVLEVDNTIRSNDCINVDITDEFDKEIDEFIDKVLPYRLVSGAIVMNCNPFTLGHRYLIESAAKEVDRLFVFVVEEDSSYFSFEDRIELVKKGTADLKNVYVLPSGAYMISKKTFAAYSNKANMQDQIVDPSMDVEIFAKKIAPKLGITIRFAGEEPLDNVTLQYNNSMKRILPLNGIEFKVIKRKEYGGVPISASRVRKLLSEKNFDAIREIVPNTTYSYLINKYGND